MHKFIAARPTVGGWLTLFNIVIVLALILTHEYIPRVLVVGFILFLSLPISWIFILPCQPPITLPVVIAECLAIGLNAFLWGYGMAWLIRFLTPLRLRKTS
jgi:hypothetical protein